VLARVHASDVNPLDTKIRAGKAEHAKQPLPAALALDMAGVVQEASPGVTTFRPGDEIYGELLRRLHIPASADGSGPGPPR
jgi:NADPH:quinone reductase